MKLRFALVLAVTFFAVPLAAQDVRAQIVEQLREQGYSEIDVSKTWLGRLRFEARSTEQQREIIVNPRTGEILRDFLAPQDKQNARGVQILNRTAPRPKPQGVERPSPQGGRPSGPAPDGFHGAGGPDGPGGPSGPSGPSR